LLQRAHTTGRNWFSLTRGFGEIRKKVSKAADEDFMLDQPDDRERVVRALDQTARILERFLQILLSIGAVAVFSGAVWIMLIMDSGSRSQGGRLYVAIGAAVALGAIESQFERLALRRRPLWRHGAGERTYRRNLLLRVALLLLAALLLVGLALIMP
jgi:hypothetical protein